MRRPTTDMGREVAKRTEDDPPARARLTAALFDAAASERPQALSRTS
jgi:hypothetical protein